MKPQSAVARRIREALVKERQLTRDEELWAELEDDLSRQIHALQERKRMVESERDHLKLDLAHMKQTLRKEGLTYGRNIYYEWCQRLHSRLPRELRDQIYSYVTLWDPSLSISTDLDDVVNLSRSLTQQLEDYLKDKGVDDLADPARVGRQNAKEMVEFVISQTRFVIRGHKHPERLLPPLFDIDLLGLGVDLLAHVQNIRIVFDTNNWDQNCHVYVPFLDMLGKLKHRHAVSVHIDHDSCYLPQASQWPLQILEDIAGWLYGMKNAGFDVHVEMLIFGLCIDACQHIGTCIDDFEGFKASWPEDQSDEDAYDAFYKSLAYAPEREDSPEG